MPGQPAVRIIAPPELPALIMRLNAGDRALAAGMAINAWAPMLTRELIEGSLKVGGKGAYVRGWLATPNGSKGLTVNNSFSKAIFVEYPTKPHEITPKYKQALAWTPGAGAFSSNRVSASTKALRSMVFSVVRKSVKHPGFKGRFVFKLTMQAYSDEFFGLLMKEVKGYILGKPLI